MDKKIPTSFMDGPRARVLNVEGCYTAMAPTKSDIKFENFG